MLELEAWRQKKRPVGQILADWYGTYKERIRLELTAILSKLKQTYKKKNINRLVDLMQDYEFSGDRPISNNKPKRAQRLQAIPYWKQNPGGKIVRTKIVCWNCKKSIYKYPNEKCPKCGAKARGPEPSRR
jgi:hypothetical protein